MLVTGRVKQVSVYRHLDKDLVSITLVTKRETIWKFSLGDRSKMLPDGIPNFFSSKIVELLNAPYCKIECEKQTCKLILIQSLNLVRKLIFKMNDNLFQSRIGGVFS